MNKSELISAMAAEAGLSKADSKRALDAFIASVTKALKAGDKVALVGFGTFSVTERAGRVGINPATKKPIQIPAKKVAKFRAGSELTIEYRTEIGSIRNWRIESAVRTGCSGCTGTVAEDQERI